MTLENDAELNALRAALSDADPREAGDADHAACDYCRRGDAVTTEDRRVANTTIRRHTCERCGAVGASLTRARRGSPSLIRTTGDVRVFDLTADENADLRGTF